ncbi:unnamed protein product [Caenorhabditis angaria]|uniref:MARVEL domain-containing protein n=1 Tax=Caenorhabditis angaria TaxID=860376 RepID=A0A9P1IIM9_9PELO|nr:unnamed protein product [Caenorhabditis angaria]
MTKPITWFATWLPLIKLAQAVCLAVVILLFVDGREQWFVYNLVFIFSALATAFALISILFRYFELNGSRQVSFNVVELSLNALCTIISFSLSCALLWDIWNMRKGKHEITYHTRFPPHFIGNQAWMRRCVIVATTLLITGILFLITYLKLHHSHSSRN